jgi:hypothetical protein
MGRRIRAGAPVALALALSGWAQAGESGLAVGTEAPALSGKAWITADGNAPVMKDKVVLLHFWFGG